MVGAILLFGGILRLGFVTDLLSKPIRVGYLNAVALLVLISQVPKLLGFSIDSGSLFGDVVAIGAGIAAGEVQPLALVFGVASLVVIVGLTWARSPVPGVLVAVVAATALTAILGLADRLPVVGALPQGLPAPALGGLEWADVAALALPAAGIALVAFTDTAVLSRTFAARRGETVSGSGEMAAIGAANIGAGLLGGFPISASSSRTPVAEQAGARTQLTGVVGAVADHGVHAPRAGTHGVPAVGDPRRRRDRGGRPPHRRARLRAARADGPGRRVPLARGLRRRARVRRAHRHRGGDRALARWHS